MELWLVHSKNEFKRGKNHLNGIESFGHFAKRLIAKFNGLSDKTLVLNLKECEFRSNHRDEDLLPIASAVLKRCKSRTMISKPWDR